MNRLLSRELHQGFVKTRNTEHTYCGTLKEVTGFAESKQASMEKSEGCGPGLLWGSLPNPNLQ